MKCWFRDCMSESEADWQQGDLWIKPDCVTIQTERNDSWTTVADLGYVQATVSTSSLWVHGQECVKYPDYKAVGYEIKFSKPRVKKESK
jgi:hypothetical protein